MSELNVLEELKKNAYDLAVTLAIAQFGSEAVPVISIAAKVIDSIISSLRIGAEPNQVIVTLGPNAESTVVVDWGNK